MAQALINNMEDIEGRTPNPGEAEKVVNTGPARIFVEPPAPPITYTRHHIRILQAGWLGHTGEFGGVQFTDGVSNEPVGRFEVDRIASLIMIENCDGEVGVQVGPAKRALDGKLMTIPMLDPLETATPEQLEALNKASAEAVAASQVQIKLYTDEELMKVADEGGINGLREIAAPLNVKSRSIPDLITAILMAQSIVVERHKAANAPEVPAPIVVNGPAETNPVIVIAPAAK